MECLLHGLRTAKHPTDICYVDAELLIMLLRSGRVARCERPDAEPFAASTLSVKRRANAHRCKAVILAGAAHPARDPATMLSLPLETLHAIASLLAAPDAHYYLMYARLWTGHSTEL